MQKGLIKADLHLHTWRSFDSWSSPARQLRALMERGFDCVAVTDHDTIRGAQEMAALAPDWFKVIIGQEIYTWDGEVLALFVQEEIPGAMTIPKTIDAVREQGGVVGVPHPMARTARSRLGADVTIRYAHLFDFIETVNGRNTYPQDERSAHRLATQLGLPRSAGSDAHGSSAIGNSYTLMPPFQGPADFVESLKQSIQVSMASTPLFFSALSLMINAPRMAPSTLAYLRKSGMLRI